MSTPSVPARAGPRRPFRIEPAPLGAPLFLLNLKVYPDVIGDPAERLGSRLQTLAARAGVAAAIAPALVDVGRLARGLHIPVLAQHVDPVDAGPRTGFTTAEALEAVGARGSLVNHSEHPLRPADVTRVVGLLKARGLAAVVCARDAKAAARLARTSPSYLAVEPPELIGTGRSVSRVRPEVIAETVAAVRRVSRATRVLCGAGIVDGGDVRRALELGAEGVLVASAVALAREPARAIRELLSGFRGP